MRETYDKKHHKQMPGLVSWIVVCRTFKRDNITARTLAMQELKHCIYTGSGGITNLKAFMSKFKAARNHISEAGNGNVYDDHTLAQAFDAEFRKVPEFRDFVCLKIKPSAMTSKYRTFQYQW